MMMMLSLLFGRWSRRFLRPRRRRPPIGGGRDDDGRNVVLDDDTTNDAIVTFFFVVVVSSKFWIRFRSDSFFLFCGIIGNDF